MYFDKFRFVIKKKTAAKPTARRDNPLIWKSLNTYNGLVAICALCNDYILDPMSIYIYI